MIKRIAILIGLILPVFVLASPQAMAVDVLDPVCQVTPDNPNPPSDSVVCRSDSSGASDENNPLYGPQGIITRAVQILGFVVGVAALFTLILSGFRMLTSGGDAGRVSSARNGIIFAFVGIAVAVTSQLIVTFVLKKLS